MSNQSQCPSCKSFKVKLRDHTHYLSRSVLYGLMTVLIYILIVYADLGGIFTGLCLLVFLTLALNAIYNLIRFKEDGGECKGCGYKFDLDQKGS